MAAGLKGRYGCRELQSLWKARAEALGRDGNDHSAVKLTIPELERAADTVDWVNVCRE